MKQLADRERLHWIGFGRLSDYHVDRRQAILGNSLHDSKGAVCGREPTPTKPIYTSTHKIGKKKNANHLPPNSWCSAKLWCSPIQLIISACGRIQLKFRHWPTQVLENTHASVKDRKGLCQAGHVPLCQGSRRGPEFLTCVGYPECNHDGPISNTDLWSIFGQQQALLLHGLWGNFMPINMIISIVPFVGTALSVQFALFGIAASDEKISARRKNDFKMINICFIWPRFYSVLTSSFPSSQQHLHVHYCGTFYKPISYTTRYMTEIHAMPQEDNLV